MKSIFYDWYFSLTIFIIGLTMFIKYLVPETQNDLIIEFAGELIMWLAITITFFTRFIMQIKKARSPKI